MTAGRFVVIGDSFSEGVGDPHVLYPNGLRGWGDRVARQLGRHDRRWEYANLAIRSKVLAEVVDQQVEAAIELAPTHVSFYAGGNDILSLRTDMARLMERYEDALARLSESGARVLVFTAFDTRASALLEPLRRRVLVFNDTVRRLAEKHDAVLLDHTLMREYDDPRLWAPDKLHMSRLGHKRMAGFVMAEGLRVPHTLKIRDLGPREPRQWRRAVVDEVGFVRTEVVPLVRRRLARSRDEDPVPPKWPEPIRPAQGMKRLAGARSGSTLRDRVGRRPA